MTLKAGKRAPHSSLAVAEPFKVCVSIQPQSEQKEAPDHARMLKDFYRKVG